MGWGKPISILLLVVLAGCATPTPLQVTLVTIPPVPTNTFVPAESSIPSTATSIATATIASPLITGRNYLAYLKLVEEQAFIIFLDEHGQSTKKVLLPIDISMQGNYLRYDLQGLSPDGKWLAYYTGLPDIFSMFLTRLPSQGPYDLSLYLFNTDTKESKFITKLISEDFPNNFRQQTDAFIKTSLPGELYGDANAIALGLYDSFQSGIRTAVWSPDGRYLAFAGQMNGLSSDLYVYDMSSQNIRQMSSGPEEIQWISWSPDGKGILHGSTYAVGEGMNCRTYIANLEGTSAIYLSKSIGCFAPTLWINNHTYLEYDCQQGCLKLRSVDIFTGAIVDYWDGEFHSLAADPEKGLIAMINPYAETFLSDPNSTFLPGMYLINAANGIKTRLLDGMWSTYYFGAGNRRFVILNELTGQGDYFLRGDGTLLPMGSSYDMVSLAPDQQHWVGIGNDKLSVFTVNDTLLREVKFSSQNNRSIIWSPDSSGLFISRWVTSDAFYLFYIDLFEGNPVLIENNGPSFYRWITPRP